MTTQEIADKLVDYCRKGEFEQAQRELYADNAVSLEPKGTPVERAEGLESIIQKGDMFQKMVEEFHGFEVSEPLVAGGFITTRLTMDVKMNGRPRSKDEEICLYEVKDGKIVKEQFFYHPQTS